MGQKGLDQQMYLCIDTRTLEVKSYHIPGGIHVGRNSVDLTLQLKTYSNLGDQAYLDVNITSMTDKTISGTFSGRLGEVKGKHTDANGNIVLECIYHQLTNGKFSNAQFLAN